MNLEAAGVELTERGFIAVDENCQTSAEGIYAMGDVIGPPALATASMEQGRRAARHGLGLEIADKSNFMPVGIYTLPEIASVGMTEAEAAAAGENPVIGRASFDEIARGQINGEHDGMLKLVCDSTGRKLLGAHVIGGNATELIHLAQLAMVGGLGVDVFIDNIFNFPTMAEGYRVAALDIADKRSASMKLAS
jgi:NAD(P) transhydrogenase